MSSDGTSMNSVSRRTRSRWDEYYKINYSELKKEIDQESSGNSRRGKRVQNAVDSVHTIVNGDGKNRWRKQDVVIISERRVGVKNIEHVESSGSRRSRNVARKRVEQGKDSNVASGKKRKLDSKTKIDGDDALMTDDDIEFLVEQVVSNSSSLKIEIGSKSGSRSKVENLDEVVSSVTKKVGYRKVGIDSGGNRGSRGRGRPRFGPVDGERMHRDVSIDVENFIDLGSSTESSEGSDASDDFKSTSEEDEEDEEDDELSDKDYIAGKSSSSESSLDDSDSDSDSGSGDEMEKDDECDVGEDDGVEEGEEKNLSDTVGYKRTLGTHKKSARVDSKKVSDIEQENHDDDDGGGGNYEGYNVDNDGSRDWNISSDERKMEDAMIFINEKEFSSVGKSMKKETEVELERDDKIDEGYRATYDSKDRDKTSTNRKKEGATRVVIDDEEFHSIKNSTRINQKERKDEDSFGSLTARNVRKEAKDNSNEKEAKDNSNEISCKRRNIFEEDDLVDSDKGNDIEEIHLAKRLRPRKNSESQKKEPELGRDKSPAPIESASSMDNEQKSSRDEDCCRIEEVAKRGEQCSQEKVQIEKKKPRAAKNLDLLKILVESMNGHKQQKYKFEENALPQNVLPLKFRFEDEVVLPLDKSEYEKHIDSLFCDLELGLRETEIDCADYSVMENDEVDSIEIDESPAACCERGDHQPFLDEQIGIVCKCCATVILGIKYVLPPFLTAPSGRQDRKDFDESPSPFVTELQFPGSACKPPDYTSCTRGTVWDLIPGIEKEMYPHQREGFEFIWKNIAGDIIIEKLKEPLPDGRGCIISHAPGTGKTRLTIVFLQTFLKLCPTCCPVIIAPRGMLLTWESEFRKWNVDIPFHNMNKKELSGAENAAAAHIFGHVGAKTLSKDCIRLLKLYSWTRGRSILGVSYTLFEKLAGENGKEGIHEKIKEVLLERPGLLVLDEGHTPRNERSLIWKALSSVATQRRIILSGTPFQNNLIELYNTLCLVNPKFAFQFGCENSTSCRTQGQKDSVARKRWTTFTNSISKNEDDGLKKLRAMLDPFVHVHKGTILQEKLPGLRHTLVFLHPTDCQKTLLETSSKVRNVFRRIRQVSLVSVHPSLKAVMKKHPDEKSKLEEIETDVDAGVKAKFLMKLIWLADALGERVLVFSQFLHPLVYIKKQIESHLSWSEGREILYMDGQLDEKQRQDSISSFNDDTSEAKLLLASERACSEGINLVGASRVILLDTVWNPSVEKQAISRAYRLGQKKVVYVYRLFTSGIEVRQYTQQIKKERISQLIFSPGDEQTCTSEKSNVVSEDKVMEAMLSLEKFNHIFEKVICQPKECDLIEIFGLEEQS